jgi:hypothetical protein
MTTLPGQTKRLNPSASGSPRRAAYDTPGSCPPHSWDCPVLTKRDPLAIAWTCSNCGAIVNAPVGAPRPPEAAPVVAAA